MFCVSVYCCVVNTSLHTLQRATTMGGTTLGVIRREYCNGKIHARQEVDAVTLDAIQECKEVELRYDNHGHLCDVRLCYRIMHTTHSIEYREVHDDDNTVNILRIVSETTLCNTTTRTIEGED